MNGIKIAGFPLLLTCILPVAYAAKCTDTPAVVTIRSPAFDGELAIYGDGRDYVDGQDGVTALIRICGTKDMTLQLNKSNSRVVYYAFQDRLVASDSTTPAWTSGTALGAKAFLNVRNILYDYDRRAGENYTFTTTFGTNFDAPDRKSYEFRMVNTSADAPPREATDWVNTPCMTSAVRVQHLVATQTSAETWVATADLAPMTCSGLISGTPTQLGTLISYLALSSYNSGQFNMPFEISIRRKP